jgi:outer membrane receptor protein involved in Fe transport
MTPLYRYKLAIGFLSFAFAGLVSGLFAQNDEQEVFELSPFSVDAADSAGYQATSTLAGTRIKTNLKDLGASISVVTEQFMDDVGATDAQTLLSYVSNTEVGGYQGNFTGAAEQAQSRYYQTEERTNPQRNQRIRGLGAADLTRGFFLTDIPFDGYNTERVTVSRGPNSILFGIGSPGGVINNATKRAVQNSDFGEFGFRLDSFDSLRFTFDYNKSLIEDKLAVRIAALEESQKYKQDPAHEDQTRF